MNNEEKQKIISLLYEIIDDGFDKGGPLIIYSTKREYYRINYYKSNKENCIETGYIFLSEDSSLEKTLASKKFNGLKIDNIQKISKDELPKNVKPMNSNVNDLISFKLDLSLSKPKWFSIHNDSKQSYIQVIISEKEILENPTIYNLLKKYDYKFVGQLCNIKIKKGQDSLFNAIKQLKPILKKRYDFLYSHRIVERCCCELQNQCILEKRCLSENREMQMKCSFRKLKERESNFTLPAKYSYRK